MKIVLTVDMLKSGLFQKLVLLAGLIVSFDSYSHDLGVIGKTYPIAERDMLEVISERLDQKKKSGELDALNSELTDRSKGYAQRPPGVLLPRAAEYRAVEINPVYTLDQDITDADGKIIYFAGTKVNPLEIRPLTKILCFVDGDDDDQVSWMDKYCASDIKNKLVLVNGDYLKVTKDLGKRIYFDQRGYLVERFGIKAVPAVVRQSGTVLYVEEFPIN